MSAANPMKRRPNRAQERLARVVDEGQALSYRVENVLNQQNVFSALFAIGLATNIVAATDATTAEKNAQESLYAREFVLKTMREKPEWATDVLGFARFLANCISHLAVDTVYASGTRADHQRTFEVA